MARTYTKLMVSLATDVEFQGLTERAKYLYLMLLAQPKLSSAGCIPYQPTKWVRWSPDSSLEGVARAIGELEAARFVFVDNETEELVIRSFIRHDGGFKNPKMLKAVENSIALIESRHLADVATTELAKALVERRNAFDRMDDAIDDGIETGSNPEPNCSLQPATTPVNDMQQPAAPLGSPLVFLSDTQQAAAAAAYERWITHRLKEPDVQKPRALEAHLRAEAVTEWHGKIHAHFMAHPDASADELLYDVFSINPSSGKRRVS